MINAIVVGVLAWGLAVRIWLLSAPMDYDEAYTFLFYVRQSFLTCIGYYNLPNNHILNSLIGWWIDKVATPEPWVLRLAPLLLGICCLYSVYLGLQAFFEKRVAFLASLVAWVSFPFVVYSSLMRGYIFQVFFIFLGLFFLKQSKFWKAAICWALALWSVPTTFYPLGLCLVALFILRKMDLRSVWNFLVKTGIITGILYLPAIIYVGLFGTKMFLVKEGFSVEYFVNSFMKTASFVWAPGAWIALFTLPALGLLLQKNKERKFFFIFLGFIAVVLLLNRSVLSYDRVWIWSLPFAAGFLLQALDAPWWPKNVRAWTFLIFLLPLMWTTHHRVFSQHRVGESYDVRFLHEDLKAHIQPGDFILVSQSTVTLLNYWQAVETGQRLQEFQHFFIAGDWFYSLYRLKAGQELLQRKIGTSRFWAVLESEEDLSKATALVQDFVGNRWLVESRSVQLARFRSARLAEIELKQAF